MKDPDHEAENPMCACPTCINEGWKMSNPDPKKPKKDHPWRKRQRPTKGHRHDN